MNNKVQIQFAKKSNFEECYNIGKQFKDSYIKEGIFQKLVENKEILLASINNKIVGFISYRILWDDTFLLQFLRVDKSFHRLGVATKLVNKVEDIAKKEQMIEIMSTSRENNITSIKFHKKLGYKESGYINFNSETEKEIVFLKKI